MNEHHRYYNAGYWLGVITGFTASLLVGLIVWEVMK